MISRAATFKKRKMFSLLIAITLIVNVHSKPSVLVIRSAEIIDRINSNPNGTWDAASYGTVELDLKAFSESRLGAKLDLGRLRETQNERSVNIATVDDTQLPKNFRWKPTKKLNCPFDRIRDQSNCGSCWAVSTAAAFSDRVCIKSKGKIRTPLSASFVASCDSSNFGCEGGYMDRVYDFLKFNGTVTGGEYESDEGCQPYPIRPCGNKPFLMPCARTFTPKCRQTTCTNDWYPHKQEQNIFKIESWQLLKNETAARMELYKNGPITAAFSVYADFPFYKSGIYSRESTIPLGGHAVRVIGWGEENGLKYWLVANSWGTDWGEDGFFRIKRGVNECEFENQLQALTPII